MFSCSQQVIIKILSYKDKTQVVINQNYLLKSELVSVDLLHLEGNWLSVHCISSYQEFALLFPLGALSIGVSVGLRHQLDQLPLVPGGLWTVLESFHHFLLLASLPVLLNKAPFSHSLRVVQHHWEAGKDRQKTSAPRKRKQSRGMTLVCVSP